MALIRPIPTSKSFIDLDDDEYLLKTQSGASTTGTITSGATINTTSGIFSEIIANVENFSSLSISVNSSSIGAIVTMINSDGSITTGDQGTTDISNAKYVIVTQGGAYPGYAFSLSFS